MTAYDENVMWQYLTTQCLNKDECQIDVKDYVYFTPGTDSACYPQALEEKLIGSDGRALMSEKT